MGNLPFSSFKPFYRPLSLTLPAHSEHLQARAASYLPTLPLKNLPPSRLPPRTIPTIGHLGLPLSSPNLFSLKLTLSKLVLPIESSFNDAYGLLGRGGGDGERERGDEGFHRGHGWRIQGGEREGGSKSPLSWLRWAPS